MPAQLRSPRGALPGYVWDERMRGGRYRVLTPDGKLGRLVSQKDVASDVRTLHDASANRFAAMARDAQAGTITPADFQRAMMSETKDLHNASAALAHGGWEGMDQAAWGRNGQILRDEYKYLAGFAQDLADGKLTAAQADARARLYAGKAYSRFYAERARTTAGQFAEERWQDTGDSKECPDCQRLAQMGWVPVGMLGTVPGAGDTVCGGACRCVIHYR